MIWDPLKVSVFYHRLFLESLQHLELKVPVWKYILHFKQKFQNPTQVIVLSAMFDAWTCH